MDITHESVEIFCGERGSIYINLGICMITFSFGCYFVIRGTLNMINNHSILLYLKILFAVTSITFVGLNIFYLILCYLCITHKFRFSVHIYALHLLFYSFQLDILCLSFAARLRITFRKSQYRVSQRKIIAIFIFIGSIAIAHILLTIASIVLFAQIETIIVISSITIILYFILSWALVVMFVTRLKHLTVGQSIRYVCHCKYLFLLFNV